MSTRTHRLRIQTFDGTWITTLPTHGSHGEVADIFRGMLSDNDPDQVLSLETPSGHEVIRIRDVKRIAVDDNSEGDLLRALREMGD